jgi:acetyl esterase/lipase
VPISLLERKPIAADHRIQYGAAALQFGDLRLPALGGGKPAPVVVFLHGGWWKAAYDLEYGGHLCQALKAKGIATWSLEYRRVGNEGGGWPGTFQDVAAGFEYLNELGKSYPLDLSRVVVIGHSAGGHLAYWLAGRHHVPKGSVAGVVPVSALGIKAAIGLAGAVDLRLTIDLTGWFTFAHDKDEVISLMGGAPAQVPDRYAVGNPGDLLPLNVAQVLLQGAEDDQIPSQLPQRWAERGWKMGEQILVQMIPGADHFDVCDPESKAWPTVMAAIEKALL